MFRFGLMAALAAVISTSATGQNTTNADGNQGIAIVGATVLPMTDTERLEDQTVLVQGDRILSVGPRAQVADS